MAAPLRVLLVCSGLDHARRGYESFARECFEELRESGQIALELAKGSGPPGPQEVRVRTLRRDNLIARELGRAFGFRPYRLEALAFSLGLQFLLSRRRPDLVYTSEWDTARGLAFARRLVRHRFKLLLCNGGFADHGFDHLDHVQQLTPAARDHVLGQGEDPDKHTVLPLGFAIPRVLRPVLDPERDALRAKWRLPRGRRIVVSVAALNRSHKRLDYLIDEVAALPGPRPFLLLVGAADEETPALRSYAAERLGDASHRFLSVAADEVPELLRASDLFVLTSLAEMQGRAVIEAMSQGLRCAVHGSPVMRFAVGEHGIFGDFAQPGSLTRLLSSPGILEPDTSRAACRHRLVYERFSWDSLRPRYLELFSAVAAGAAKRMVSSSTAEKLST